MRNSGLNKLYRFGLCLNAYCLIFNDCRVIRWNLHDQEEVGEPLADLIGIHLGKDSHRKPAVIHTDIFEIAILYGSFRVEKDAIAQQNPLQD